MSTILISFNFITYIATKKLLTGKKFFIVLEIILGILSPIFFLTITDFTQLNNCCSESALFSPEHRIGIYILIGMSMLAYTISIFRKEIIPPIMELFLNVFLVLGLVLNVVIIMHLYTPNFDNFLWVLFGNIPIMMLILIKLSQHHILFQEYIKKNKIKVNNSFGKMAFDVLNMKATMKYPILLMMIVPILIFLSLFLILFGQKPDSLIKAFTQTYKHGFSQIDYMCDNVNCGDHFLCSVGANGHATVVKPIRYGVRNGGKIICNRQLLVSNAFEELIQEKFPALHKLIRRNYNKVGNIVHKYYKIFNIKFVSDITYVLMKPLEWIFLFTLYSFDKKPENRIAKQYLSNEDREKLLQ